MSGGVSERVVLVTVFCLVWQCLGAKAARAGEVLSLSAARRPAPWRGVRGVVSRLSAPSGLRAPASARAAAGQIEFEILLHNHDLHVGRRLSGRCHVHGLLTSHAHTSRISHDSPSRCHLTHAEDCRHRHAHRGHGSRHSRAAAVPPERLCRRRGPGGVAVQGAVHGTAAYSLQYSAYGFTRTHRRQERRMSTALGSCTPWHALGCSSLHHHT